MNYFLKSCVPDAKKQRNFFPWLAIVAKMVFETVLKLVYMESSIVVALTWVAKYFFALDHLPNARKEIANIC